MPIQFYPQTNLSLNAQGNSPFALAPAANIGATPSLVGPPVTGNQLSVQPGGNYSVEAGLAQAAANTAPLKAAANELVNYLDPVNTAERKAKIQALQYQTEEAPLKHELAMTQNKAILSFYKGLGGGGTNSTTGGGNDTAGGLTASGVAGSPLSPNSQASDLEQAANLHNDTLGNNHGIYQVFNPATGTFEMKTDPGYARKEMIYGNYIKELRDKVRQKGMPTADTATVKQMYDFDTSPDSQGSYDKDIDKYVRAVPSLISTENQLAQAAQDPNLPDRDLTSVGRWLANVSPFTPDLEKTALSNYDSSAATLKGALAKVVNPVGGYNGRDAALVNAMSGNEQWNPFSGGAAKTSLKQRIGENVGGVLSNLQDFKKMDKYVHPQAFSEVKTGINNIGKTLSSVPSSTNSSDAFSPNFANPTDVQPDSTTSVPEKSQITPEEIDGLKAWLKANPKSATVLAQKNPAIAQLLKQ